MKSNCHLEFQTKQCHKKSGQKSHGGVKRIKYFNSKEFPSWSACLFKLPSKFFKLVSIESILSYKNSWGKKHKIWSWLFGKKKLYRTFSVVDEIKMARNIRAVIELKNRFGCHTSWACLWFLVSSHPHHQSARISNPWFDVFVNFHGGFLTLEHKWVGKIYEGAILKLIPMIIYFVNIF